MHKRAIAFILTAIFCFSLMSACSKSSDNNEDVTASVTGPALLSDTENISSDPEPESDIPQPSPAEAYVDNLTLEQQISQMFFVCCPVSSSLSLAAEYDIGGYILFGSDFRNQTPESVTARISAFQNISDIPMLIGVDEEGGSVVRVSAYDAFRSQSFQAPRTLYAQGGMDAIVADTVEKDALLSSLGINVNLGPVCDISTDPGDFMYSRSLGQDAGTTYEFVKAVVNQMNSDQMGSVLKHFPGYGNNSDTHTGIAIDERSLESFRSEDFLPFSAGIEAGVGSIMVSHNIVTSMDETLPASLSPAVHEILREELGFEGVIMTDDLKMSAITQYTDGENAAVLAVIAGNDMLICSDFLGSYTAVLNAVNDGTISPEQIRASAIRIIQWKMDLGLIPEDGTSDME